MSDLESEAGTSLLVPPYYLPFLIVCGMYILRSEQESSIRKLGQEALRDLVPEEAQVCVCHLEQAGK